MWLRSQCQARWQFWLIYTITGPGDCYGAHAVGRNSATLAITSNSGATRSIRSIPGTSFRGHESVRHPRQTRYHHAKRHSISKENTRGLGWTWVSAGSSFLHVLSLYVGMSGAWSCGSGLGRLAFSMETSGMGWDFCRTLGVICVSCCLGKREYHGLCRCDEQ